METEKITHYRDYLQRYAETTRRRRPGFSLGSWAKALGLKSTSSLSKVLNGEREAGAELIEKLVRYFEFTSAEEEQFRNLVVLSKLKENNERKEALTESLLHTQALKDIRVRMLEFDQFQLFSSYLPLAVRELTRLTKMKIATLTRILPNTTEKEISEAMHVLAKMNLVKRDVEGSFVSTDDHVSTEHVAPSDAIRSYHQNGLDLAKNHIETGEPIDRELQSLVLLVHSQKIPHLKEKIRKFMDTLELEADSETVDQLYQVQIQMIPISKRFEEHQNPNQTKETVL